jgi:protein-tyrosine phosphatase
MPIKIMFVCLGNICRSPLAEGVFRDAVQERGLADHFEIASSGTGNYHVGEQADPRMRQTAHEQDLSLQDHTAQQFAASDLPYYDHIFVMDKSNLSDVLRLDARDEYNGKVRLFREFDPDPGTFQVPDPYSGGAEGFRNVYDIVERTSHELLDRLVEEHDLRADGRARA